MGKQVCIMGASRGLGFCMARAYLEQGDTVYMGVRGTGSDEMQALLGRYPDTAVPVLVDVAKTLSVAGAAREVAKRTDRLDILINNAGIHSATSFDGIEDTDLDECVEVYSVNAVGPIRVVKAFMALLAEGAQIVNISSESGSVGICERDRQFGYCMSKSALNMGSKLLQNLLAPQGVKVLIVHPGWMRTDMGGPNAHLDPMENAYGLVKLFPQFTDPDGPMFIDYEGVELPW